MGRREHEEAAGMCTGLQCLAWAGHKCRLPVCPVPGGHSGEEIPIPGTSQILPKSRSVSHLLLLSPARLTASLDMETVCDPNSSGSSPTCYPRERMKTLPQRQMYQYLGNQSSRQVMLPRSPSEQVKWAWGCSTLTGECLTACRQGGPEQGVMTVTVIPSSYGVSRPTSRIGHMASAVVPPSVLQNL